MTVIGIIMGVAVLAAFGVVFYYRVIDGRSADMKKRDEHGKIIR